LLREVHADAIEVFEDSMLVINQLAGSYECRSEVLIAYYEKSMRLLKEFKDFHLEHVP
jgi:ribonuclease HI